MKAKAQIEQLPYGDFAFEGNGPQGQILVGIERKTLSDMLNCIDDARYVGQKVGMRKMYRVSILMIEGVWKPDTLTGYLMECIATLTWKPLRYRSQMTRYSKLFRYLLTVQLSGVCVIWTRDIEHTAYNIIECYHYFQKKWEDHTSLMEIHRMNLPELNGKPSLVRRWASDLDDIGVKYSQIAEGLFRTPIRLATADESAWLRIKGIGIGTAQNIIRQIHNVWR
jgi:ERCC4-type nuclease